MFFHGWISSLVEVVRVECFGEFILETRHKCAIDEPEICRGDVYLSLKINLAWFGGLELHIHWLTNWSLICLRFSMQGRLNGDKILSSLSYIWWEWLIFIQRMFFSQLFLIRSLKVVRNTTFIHLKVVARSPFLTKEEEE